MSPEKEMKPRQDLELPEDAPSVIPFDPPAPILALDEEGGAILEPLHKLTAGMRVALPNMWTEDKDRFLVGVIRGRNGVFVLEVGRSVGKVEYYGEQGWRCSALARMSVIAEGLAAMEAVESRSFTERLMKKAAKAKAKKTVKLRKK